MKRSTLKNLTLPLAYGIASLALSPAHADATDDKIKSPVHVHCQGDAGYLDATVKNFALQYELSVSGVSEKGSIEFLDNESVLSNASVYHTQSSQQKDGKYPVWLSLGGQAADKVWVPALEKCLATRVPGKCVEVQMPGQFQNRWNTFIDIMLDEPTPGNFTFNRIEIDLPNHHKVIQNLGENAICAVEGVMNHE